MGDISKMNYSRWLEDPFRMKLDRPYVHILFGARQTGKSTLLNSLVPSDTLVINLANPLERSRHLADPGEFVKICRALSKSEKPQTIFVDEAQSVPSVFDSVQYLYDENKERWRFILCGSSARKLRLTGANLLPGRSLVHHLYPLTLLERPPEEAPGLAGRSILPFRWTTQNRSRHPFPNGSLLDRLAFGDLPGIVIADPQDRADLLKTYAFVYLEEEIRREALVKDWGTFLKFLKFAATESGQIINFAAVSQETGISKPTVKTYYQLLEDMFVGFQVPAFSKSPRKNLLSSPKFILFDLGVRHAAAGLLPSIDTVRANPGPIFEQWVGIELFKRLQYLGSGTLNHLRTKDGAEVDFIIDHDGELTPIEVKWTENPSLSDCRSLLTFLEENPRKSKEGFVVCRCPRPLRLHKKITALPWHAL